MDKTTASRILEAALSLGESINAVDSQIGLIENQQEKKEFVDALGSILEIVTIKFVFRIVREYPELDPDKPKVD